MSLKPIIIEGNTIEPTLQGPGHPLADRDAENAAGTKYILIQSDGLLSHDQKLEPHSYGVNIQKLVSDQTYLCEYDPDDLKRLRDKDFVNYAIVYLEDLKISAELKEETSAPAEDAAAPAAPQSITVNILFHDGVDASSVEIQRKLAEKAHINVEDLDATS